MSFEPRVLVKHKTNGHYLVWLYETKDWDGSTPYYKDHWDIVAFAHTQEERDAIKATADYHAQLMKENQNA